MKQLNNEELARKTALELLDNTASHWYDIILSALNEAGKATDKDARELLDRLEHCADEEEGDITRKYCAELRKRYPTRDKP